MLIQFFYSFFIFLDFLMSNPSLTDFDPSYANFDPSYTQNRIIIRVTRNQLGNESEYSPELSAESAEF